MKKVTDLPLLGASDGGSGEMTKRDFSGLSFQGSQDCGYFGPQHIHGSMDIIMLYLNKNLYSSYLGRYKYASSTAEHHSVSTFTVPSYSFEGAEGKETVVDFVNVQVGTDMVLCKYSTRCLERYILKANFDAASRIRFSACEDSSS